MTSGVWAARGFVLILSVSALSGCLSVGEYNRAMPKDSKQWGSFALGQIYVTTTDLFIMDTKRKPFGLELAVGGKNGAGSAFGKRGPTTAEKYKEHPEMWPEVSGILDAETPIRIAELREHGSVHPLAMLWFGGNPRFLHVKAEILQGPHKGVLVDLLEISDYDMKGDPPSNVLMGPDSSFLRQLSK